MRGQTTIEFMVLTIASASLMLAAAGAYLGVSHSQRGLYDAIATSQIAKPNSTASIPQSASASVTALMPSNTVPGIATSLDAVISLPPNYSMRFVSLSGPADASWSPSNYSGITSEGVYILQFNVVMSSTGNHAFRVTATVDSPSGTQNIYADTYTNAAQAANPTASTTTVPQASGPTFSAAISNRNESVVYPLQQPAPVYYVKEWSHCSYKDFFYHQLSIAAQCGGANWYFWAFSDSCYWNNGITSATYCVELVPAGYSTNQIGDQDGYWYSFNLTLAKGPESLSSTISSGNAISAVYKTGSASQVGSASVTYVSGIGPSSLASYVAKGNSTSIGLVSKEAYGGYSQALSSLYSSMGYHNNTGVDPGTLSSLLDDIGTFNIASSSFTRTATHNVSGCAFGVGRSIACAPPTPLYYDINVSLPGNATVKQSLSVDGSTITVG